MTDSNQALPIAGWYPDPENDKSDRWWNGTMWSDHRRARNAAPAAPAAPAATVAAPVAPVSPVSPAEQSPVTAAPADGSDFARPNPYAAPAAATPASAYGATPAYGSTAPAYGTAPAYPGAQSPYQTPQQYAPYAYAPAEPRNGMAIAALITALSGIVLNLVLNPLVGAVLGFLALKRSNELAATGQVNTGRGMAIAAIISGLVLGIGALLLYVIIGISISTSSY